MGKKRKTYREKLLADFRRRVYRLKGVNVASFGHQTNNRVTTPSPTLDVLQSPHPYLLKDLSKTIILTTSIIAIQIILFIILKNKILSVLGVTY